MLTAMCTQEMRFREAYERRSIPRQGPFQSCPGPDPNRDYGDLRAIRETPTGLAPGLPAKFFDQPTVSDLVAAGPVAIPEGTIIQTTFARSRLSGESIAVARDQLVAQLDQPIQSGGKVLVQAGKEIHLKARVLGPGSEPNSVRIAIAADYLETSDQRRVNFTSSEIVQTYVANSLGPRSPGVALGIENGAKMSFTVGPGQAALATPASAPTSVRSPAAAPIPGQSLPQIPSRTIARQPPPPSAAPAVVQPAFDRAAPAHPVEPMPQGVGTNAAMRDLSQRYTELVARSTQAKAGLAQIEQQLARQRLGLRSDIVNARTRMDTQLRAANESISRGDANQAEQSLQYAQAALETLEKFLGR